MTDLSGTEAKDAPVAAAASAVTLARATGSAPARWTWGQLGLLVVLAAFVLFTVPNPSLAIGMLIFGLWAAGLNLLVGYGGLVSFGHYLPFAWGGYAAGLVLKHVTTSAWVALFVATVSMAVLSALIGAICLRRTEVYFSMLTLAFAQLGFFIALQWNSVTGGDDGLAGVPVSTLELGFTTLELNGLRDPLTFFIVTAVIVLLTFTALILFTESPMGRVLQAIRESEERARGCGYNTRLVQLVTFVIAGAVAGLAGGLFAMLNNFVGLQPYWLLSGVVLIMVILGGRSSLFGPFLGAVLYLLLESTLSRYTDSWQFFVGAIFVVCVLLFPQGLWGLLTTTLPRLLRRTREGPMSDLILRAEGLDRSFGGIHAVKDVSLEVPRGALHAIIGPNGSGKTTLFNLITGHTKPGRGRVEFDGHDITGMPYAKVARRGLAKSYQITTVFPLLTVFENVRIAAQAASHANVFWRPADSIKAVTRRTEEVLERIGLAGDREAIAGNLSHGDQRRLDLAIALATEPRLLLLDEPTAGMSPTETAATVDLVQELNRDVTILMIEHKMDVILSIASTITVLHQGEKLFEGAPDEVKSHPKVQEVYLTGSL